MAHRYLIESYNTFNNSDSCHDNLIKSSHKFSLHLEKRNKNLFLLSKNS